MKRTAIDWIAVFAFVVIAAAAMIYMLDGNEQRHRAERAEARADSLSFELNLRDHFMVWQALDIAVAERDSLAHLADFLRERRNYWWVKAHAREVR